MADRDPAAAALAAAEQFEADGERFYRRAAQAARHPLAKAVFLALAADEEDHVRRVREIHTQLKGGGPWPAAAAPRPSAVDAALRSVTEQLAAEVDPDGDAGAALDTAEAMERNGLAFYREQLAATGDGPAAAFYRALVTEEERHLAAICRVRRDLGG